jgi:HAD superfamily hydrolase (TIGR01509 family)
MTRKTAAPEKRKIKAVLFDLDGVLVDSFEAWFRVFNDTLVHFGHTPITRKTFGKSWGTSTQEDTRLFMPERTVDEVRAYLEEVYDRYAEKYITVNPDAKLILGSIAGKKVKLACVTNSHGQMTRRILDAKGLSGYFDTVVTADDVTHPKPAPDMLFLACRRLGVRPGETAYIGDTGYDIDAGKAAGCITVLYSIQKAKPGVRSNRHKEAARGKKVLSQ